LAITASFYKQYICDLRCKIYRSATGRLQTRTHIRVSGVARPAGFRPVAWLAHKKSACLVEELLALAEQEATVEELDLRARDTRVHPFG